MRAAFLLLLNLLSTLAFAANSGVTYQGRILKPDGSPLAGQFTQFKMQIRTPDAQGCLMYEEVQSQDLRNTAGAFSLTINDGSGSRTDSSGLTLDRIFANHGTYTLDVTTCATGTGVWVPNVSDGRNLVVLFKDETMASWEPIPAQKINFVPYAFESKQIAGFTADSLIRVVNGSGDPLTGLAPLSNAQYTELMALVNGTSTAFTKSGQLGGVALPTMATGEVLGWNGSAWVSQPAVAGNNSVTTAMIQANAVDATKLANGAVGTSQVAGNVTINTSGTLGAAITTTRDFKIFAASPSAFYIDIQAPALAASYSLVWPMNAGASGQVLTTNGSGVLSWAPAAASSQWTTQAPGINYTGGNVGIGTTSPIDALTVSGMISGGTYPAVHRNNVDMSSDNGAFSAVTYNLDVGASPVQFLTVKGNVIGTGDVFFQGKPLTNGYTVLEGYGGKGLALGTGNGALPITFTPNRTERMRINGAGNVGIGTTSPTAVLQLKAGTTAAGTSPLKFTSGPLMSSSEDGSMEYDGAGLWFTIGATRYVIPTNTAAGNYSNVSNISNVGGAITMTPAAGNSVIVNQSTTSTSSTTGALVVNGGVGIDGALNTGGNITSGGSITATTNAVIPQLYGSTAASGSIRIDGTSNATKGNVYLASAGGYVGIGTTSPAYSLTVRQDSTTTDTLALDSEAASATGVPSIRFQGLNGFGTSGAPIARIIGSFDAANANGNLNFQVAPSGTLQTAMSIQYQGYFSFGTSGGGGNPSAFDIHGPAYDYYGSGATGTRMKQTVTASTNSVPLTGLWIDPNFNDNGHTGVSHYGLLVGAGNVGIGTTSPGTTLDVAGGIRAGSTAQVNVTCNPANEGIQRYNYTTHFMEYCNGTNWLQPVVQTVGSTANVSASGPPVSANIYTFSAATLNYAPSTGSAANTHNGVWLANGADITPCLNLPNDASSTITFDLGATQSVGNIYFNGESGYPIQYQVSFSLDGITYTNSLVISLGAGGFSALYQANAVNPIQSARYLRVLGISANSKLCQMAVGP